MKARGRAKAVEDEKWAGLGVSLCGYWQWEHVCFILDWGSLQAGCMGVAHVPSRAGLCGPGQRRRGGGQALPVSRRAMAGQQHGDLVP